MPVMAVSRFERFFRVAADLDVDKSDLKRYSDFIDQQVYDLLVRGEANAKANERDVIQPFDLPITAGLQERIHEFKRLDVDIELAPILEQLAIQPQLEIEFADETLEKLPLIVGGVSVALGRAFRLIDTRLKNPSSEHWERAFQLFDLLL